MDRLTERSIEHFRIGERERKDLQTGFIDALCDLALQSLSQEAVRDGALEALEGEHDGELWNPGVKALHGYPNLQAMLAGCVSGHHTEWPAMRAELRALLAALKDRS
jgi:hypothetical protein